MITFDLTGYDLEGYNKFIPYYLYPRRLYRGGEPVEFPARRFRWDRIRGRRSSRRIIWRPSASAMAAEDTREWARSVWSRARCRKRGGWRRKLPKSCGADGRRCPPFPQGVCASGPERVLVAAGVAREHATLVAESLVAANLRGVDSHGVHLLSLYLDQIRRGRRGCFGHGRDRLESGACMVYDGRNGLGQVISSICVGHAIRLASELGLGMVTARESNHFGAAAWWA